MIDDKGFLFLGKSGTGKSTHCKLWLNNFEDADLLNDDNPALRILPDGKVYVYGTPWSGKTPCYRPLRRLAGGFLRLEQAPKNEISRLHPVHALLRCFLPAQRWCGTNLLTNASVLQRERW